MDSRVESKEYDAIVVGSGAGGGGRHVLSTAGLKVLMLEAGRAYDPVKETPMFNWTKDAPCEERAPRISLLAFMTPLLMVVGRFPESLTVRAQMIRRESSNGGVLVCLVGEPTIGGESPQNG